MTRTEAPEQTRVPLPTLDDDQVAALIEFMEQHGQARAETQRKDFSEVDYLCGCMSALFALDLAGKIPAGWVFGPMSGRPVFPVKGVRA